MHGNFAIALLSKTMRDLRVRLPASDNWRPRRPLPLPPRIVLLVNVAAAATADAIPADGAAASGGGVAAVVAATVAAHLQRNTQCIAFKCTHAMSSKRPRRTAFGFALSSAERAHLVAAALRQEGRAHQNHVFVLPVSVFARLFDPFLQAHESYTP
jgi:hypothetical protein